MDNINAYFKLSATASGIGMIIYPAHGGKKIDLHEADLYIKSRGIEYDKAILSKAADTVSVTPMFVELCSGRKVIADESCNILIGADRMSAVIRFYPPTDDGKQLSAEDIMNEAVHAGIRFGLIDESIQKFLSERQYCTDYQIAKALEPVKGKNAEIIYYFNTDLSRKPKLNDDGSVDFHQIDNISSVLKDQCIAELKPAIQGKPGIDVTGKAIAPAKVNIRHLTPGRNMYLSEDKLKLYSAVNGHASIVDDSIFVSDTLDIEGNVDNSTGDINCEGNVNIKGNVVTGFKVFAKGDISVDGVVEGAVLNAGGQIILKRGIQGGGRGLLNAGSNIVSKFIESATVISAGYVQTEAILHSIVRSKTEINVGGKKGFITGGEMHAGISITAKTAGSAMGISTLLEVGSDPALEEECKKLENDVVTLSEQKDKDNEQIMLFVKRLKEGIKPDTEKVKHIQAIKAELDSITKKIEFANSRMDEIRANVSNNADAYIKVMDVIYPGCKLIVSEQILFIRQEAKYVKFVRDRAEVKMLALI